MKLLYFADASSIHTQRWLNYFASHHEVTLASWHRPMSGFDIRIRLLNLKRPMGWCRLLFAFTAPEIIHAHYLSTYGIVAYFYALLIRIPLVGTVWGSDIRLPRNVWKWFLTRALRKMDVITCDAEHVAKKLIGFGVAPNRIHIIFFGTNMVENHPIHIPPNVNPGVISCRTLSAMYDIDTLMKAALIVDDEIHDVIFTIAGEGPRKDYLERLGGEVGTTFIFPGRIDTNGWFPNMDLYVSTSPYDAGLSASTAEAMACGLPVVVTDVHDNAWWVEHCGELFPVGDHEALAEKLIALIRDAPKRRKMGMIGRMIIGKRNGYRKMMAKVDDLYREVFVGRWHK